MEIILSQKEAEKILADTFSHLDVSFNVTIQPNQVKVSLREIIADIQKVIDTHNSTQKVNCVKIVRDRYDLPLGLAAGLVNLLW